MSRKRVAASELLPLPAAKKPRFVYVLVPEDALEQFLDNVTTATVLPAVPPAPAAPAAAPEAAPAPAAKQTPCPGGRDGHRCNGMRTGQGLCGTCRNYPSTQYRRAKQRALTAGQSADEAEQTAMAARSRAEAERNAFRYARGGEEEDDTV
jgi:hypothetical protein